MKDQSPYTLKEHIRESASLRRHGARRAAMHPRPAAGYALAASHLIALVLLVGCVSDPPSSLAPAEREETKVKQRLAEILNAAETKDLARLDSYHWYGPHFTKFSSIGSRVDASAARDGEHKGLSALSGLKLRPDDLQVDVFRDTAVATFTMVATISSGASAITKSERGTLVFAKHEGSWKIVHEHFSASNDPKSDAELTSEESLLSVLWYQHAAECRALYYQACNIARERIGERLAWRRAHPEEARPAAIIVDIDETILDNSPYNGWLIRNHTNYQWATFENWVNATNAIALPGIVGLLRHCESSNVAVFYVSNRKATNDVLKNTIANLKAQGLPYADADHVRLRTGPESKDDRRDPILKSHDVILLMGDNLADFHHAYDITDPSGASNRLARTDLDAKLFGTRYIPLPNPMYGSWENALYAVTNKTKSAVRHKELRAFEPKEK